MPEYRSSALFRAASLGALVLAGVAAHADPVKVDFDRRADGSAASAPTVFARALPVRDEFADFGVHFTVPGGYAGNVGGGAVLTGNFGVAGYSGSNYLAYSFNPGALCANGQNPLPPQVLSFDRPVRLVRLNVGGFRGIARLTAYDAGGAPIAESMVGLLTRVAPLEVQTPGYTIRSATLLFEGSLGGIVDDLVFDVQTRENVPPVTHCSVEGTAGEAGWHLGDVHVALTAEDADGSVASTLCQLDEGAWEPYSTPILVTGEGPHTLKYYSVDNEGAKEEVKAETFKIDAGGPVVQLRLSRWFLWPCNGKKLPVKVLGSATDSGSGLASLQFEVKDEYGEVQPPLTEFGQVIVLKAAVKPRDRDGRVYSVTATATDNAGQKQTATQYVLVPKNLGNSRREYARLLHKLR
jgi:hypothetical protein